MNDKLKSAVVGLVVGGTGLAMVTAACAVYKAFKDSQQDEGERKHINVRHLRDKMEDYSYGKEFLFYHKGIPVWLVKCNMKEANKNAEFLSEGKFASPCIVYREENFFCKTEEFCVFVHIDENYKRISRKARKVVIDHELGHIFKASDPCLKFSSEAEADKYARGENGRISRREARQLSAWLSAFYETSDSWESDLMSRFG